MGAPPAVLVHNPAASAVTPARLRVVDHALRATFELRVVTTTARGHAVELARTAVADGAEAVIALGGDGTANEVANGILDGATSTDVAFAVLPAGGTNVLARALGYPRDLVEATGHLIDLVESSQTRRIALGQMQVRTSGSTAVRVFTQSCGLGLDAETVRRVEASGLRPRLGDLAFVYAWLQALRSVRAHADAPLRVLVDGDEAPAWWATVANADPTTYWGRRALRVAPDARYDGGLDVVAAGSPGLIRTLRWGIQSITTARHVHDRKLRYARGVERCEIRCASPVPLQADGEYLGAVDAVAVHLLREALPVYALQS